MNTSYLNVVTFGEAPLGVFPNRSLALQAIDKTVGEDGVDWTIFTSGYCEGTAYIPGYAYMGKVPISVSVVKLTEDASRLV